MPKHRYAELDDSDPVLGVSPSVTLSVVADGSLWLPLGTAAIGAIAALAGNTLGPMFGAQGEHKQWLRNKRAELLESFHALLDEAHHDAVRYNAWPFATTPEAASLEVREAHSRDLLGRLTAAAARAELYTSPRLAELMSRVAYDYQVVYSSADLYDETEWGDVYRSWSTDVSACTHLIREELHVD